jgi:hypothetical protein
MAIKTIAQPAPRSIGNPFSRVMAAVQRADAWLSPARHEAPGEFRSAHTTSELWMPMFMVAGAVQVTNAGPTTQGGVRK